MFSNGPKEETMGASSELRMPAIHVLTYQPKRTWWFTAREAEGPPPMSRRAVQRFHDEGAILVAELADEIAICGDNVEALTRLYDFAIRQLIDIRRRRGRPT
jgi:hypothetical protein